MTTKENKIKLASIISVFVHDDIGILEAYTATSCSFVVIEGISFGYQFIESENSETNLNRAFDILFDETLKRLKSKGIHLPL